MTLFENPVGQSLPRLETREKLTGQAAYTDDLYRPHMLHGAILHSPYPHARIVSYDVAKAKALPGVCAVVTGDDIGRHYMGPFIKDEPALAKDKVRYIGEPVAAVAAVDIETAQQAAQTDRRRVRGNSGGVRSAGGGASRRAAGPRDA